ELASVDVDVSSVRSFVVRLAAVGLPLDESGAPYRQHAGAVWRDALDHRSGMAKRVGGGVVCGASVARRIGGVGGGTERCAKRAVLDAYDGGVCGLRARAERGGVSVGGNGAGVGLDGQGHAGDAAV